MSRDREFGRPAVLAAPLPYVARPSTRPFKRRLGREQIEAALTKLLDDIERGISEDEAMGGPPQGSA